ncbi:MbtH family protein [Ningiella sp. W23]|uniref:MbtH family protein n=1 Tax=Ningiella sp. W23 TaxID=3023715 RepID=UPI003756CEAC
MNEANQHEILYYVVVNNEEQHSIWPAHKDIPAGWNSRGNAQSKDDCLDYIEENWTDITPLSARNVTKH